MMRAICFSGDLVAALTADGHIIFRVARNGVFVYEWAPRSEDASAIYSVGNEIFVGTARGHIFVLSISMNRREPPEILQDFSADDCVFISSIWADSTQVYAGCTDGKIRLWDRARGAPAGAFEGHLGAIYALEGDARRIYSGSADESIRIWDRGARRCLQSLNAHIGPVLSVRTDEEGLLSGGFDGTMRIWRSPGGVCVETLKPRAGGICAIERDDRFIYTGTADGRILIWGKHCRQLLVCLNRHPTAVRGLVLGRDDLLFSVDWNGDIRATRPSTQRTEWETSSPVSIEDYEADDDSEWAPPGERARDLNTPSRAGGRRHMKSSLRG